MQSPIDPTMTVFDRALIRRRRDRAARAWSEHAFLFREVGDRLADRLDDVQREFPKALDLGCRGGDMAGLLAGRAGVETLVQTDCSSEMVALAAGGAAGADTCFAIADEEMLPFGPDAFDLVISNLALHWTNDLPGALIQIRRALKPDGLLLASLFGADTLFELRVALMEAEMEIDGGVSPRVSPFTEVRDAGGLLQRAGFALPVVDCDVITVTYDSIFKLMRDLRGMGETNMLVERRKTPLRRATLMRAAEIYQEKFADPADEGRIPATFQVLTLTGWAPHESQQQALRPGAAKGRLADALGVEEKSAGERTGPGRR